MLPNLIEDIFTLAAGMLPGGSWDGSTLRVSPQLYKQIVVLLLTLIRYSLLEQLCHLIASGVNEGVTSVVQTDSFMGADIYKVFAVKVGMLPGPWVG